MKERKNNKGFTLVELIVVMAIMAILVGALAPQVVKYVDKARVSKDLQVESTLFTAVQTAIASSTDTVPDIDDLSLTDLAATTSGATLNKIHAEIVTLLGTELNTDRKLVDACKSSKVSDVTTDAAAEALVLINYEDSTGAISVKIGSLDEITNN